MRPVTPNEYGLEPITPVARTEPPVMISLDLQSTDPIPMTPLTQLPILAPASGGAAVKDDPSQRASAERGAAPSRDDNGNESTPVEVDDRSTGGNAWRIETSDGPVWLEGDSILCACPDCDAPMSVRLWLLLAQCWQCTTLIELSEEQQRAVESLLRRRENQVRSPARAAPVPVDRALPETRPAAARARSAAQLAADTESGNGPPPTPAGYRFRYKTGRRWLTPAWLVSLVLHFVLILLLALLAVSEYVEIDSLTLSSFVGTQDEEGGVVVEATEDSPSQFELPLPSDADLEDRDVRREMEEASDDAREIREDDSPTVELPDLALVRDQVTGDAESRSHFVARDPRLRVEIVMREGGTTMTEAAVARGLSWLARYQNLDGSWSLKDYEDSHRRSNEGDAAATSLALLPFLGAGQTHEYGRYKETVAAGLLWLLTNQEDDGDLRAGMTNQMGMYAHGQATIVLVEALALSGDERFREPAQRAIDFIVNSQHDEGGWRYTPGQPGDTSVLGWQLMALQSARSPGVGLEVPETTLQLASYYLDLCASAEGALYSYQPSERRRPTEVMTAEALLCRMYLGWPHDDPRLEAGVEYLLEDYMPSSSDRNMYYWYYATQTLHNYGGPEWERWNRRIQNVLTDLQEDSGKHAGSWDPRGFTHGRVGDRVYVTALAVCTLEVYYRHLPIFRRVELE